MVSNPEKCYVLCIHRKQLPVIYDYSIKGNILKHVEKHQDLEVTIASDLNWKHHIESIVGKANKTLGFIMRNFKHCSQEIKIQAHITIERPILECSSTKRESGCMSAKLKEMNLPSLKGRREQSRLALFRDIVQNNSAIKLPSYIVKRTRNTRHNNTDFSSFNTDICNVGLNHIEIIFFARTIRDSFKLEQSFSN
ncbi:uncharacterized protein LOC135681423 [Rhopilema esculentum]|uniref:uncharacterized protein LOC135681423 n=1 Tax=Rhopilema esculentum TaxID=499914 RepID=UPI0031CEADBE